MVEGASSQQPTAPPICGTSTKINAFNTYSSGILTRARLVESTRASEQNTSSIFKWKKIAHLTRWISSFILLLRGWSIQMKLLQMKH